MLITYFVLAVAQSTESSSGGGAPKNDQEEEDYVPPKPEVERKITEDDALYTKRYVLAGYQLHASCWEGAQP